MRMTERRLRPSELMNDEVEREKAIVAEQNQESFETSTREVPFLYLTLDLPPAPLFQDAEGASIIPQVRTPGKLSCCSWRPPWFCTLRGKKEAFIGASTCLFGM